MVNSPAATLDLFPRCHAVTMKYEGGFVSAAQAKAMNDPGGPTNRGVSLRAVVSLDLDGDGVLDFDIDGDGDVDEADIRALDGHPEKLEQFYRSRYWDTVRAGEMPWPWCLLAFDASVNHGPAGAALLIQKAIGTKQDAVIGPRTLSTIRTAPPSYVRRYVVQRAVLFARIYLNRAGATPIAGWNARLAELHEEALKP